MVYLSFVDLDQSCHELVILWVTFGHNEIAQVHDCIHCIVVNRVNVNSYIPNFENAQLYIYIHLILIPQVEKENTVDTSNSQQQRTYDADSLELQLDHGKRKNQYTKNKSSNKQPSSESGQDKIRYA